MKLALYAPILLLTAAIASTINGSTRRPGRPWLTLVLLPVLALACAVAAAEPLAGTRPLDTPGDLAEQMVAGIDRYLTHETETAIAQRAGRWKRDFASPQAYARSVAPNRERLRRIIGAVDPRVTPVEPEVIQPAGGPTEVARGRGYRVLAVRWPVLKGVDAEGLLLQPDRPAKLSVVALPDCDWTPEMLVGLSPGSPASAQFARRLAEQG